MSCVFWPCFRNMFCIYYILVFLYSIHYWTQIHFKISYKGWGSPSSHPFIFLAGLQGAPVIIGQEARYTDTEIQRGCRSIAEDWDLWRLILSKKCFNQSRKHIYYWRGLWSKPDLLREYIAPIVGIFNLFRCNMVSGKHAPSAHLYVLIRKFCRHFCM